LQTQVTFVKAPTDRDAHIAAQDEMMLFPEARLLRGVMGSQGGRRKFSCTTTNDELLELYKMAKRNQIVGQQVNKHVNREMVEEHKQVIANYVVQESDYILGGFEFNIATPIKVFHTEINSSILPAYMLITKETEIYLTDGQHRCGGLESAIPLRPALAKDCADVSFMFENDIEKIKQDFVDLGSTLRISESMMQDYNPRLPMFVPSAAVRQEVTLLRNRVDITGKTISPKSNNLFTLTVFNSALTGIVLGRADLSKNQANAQLMEAFNIEMQKECWTKRMVRFFKIFSQSNEQWRDITGSGNPQLVPRLRQQYLHLNSSGLRLVCTVAHYIFEIRDVDGKDDMEAQNHAIKTFAGWNFDRTANPLWSDIGMVSADGKFINSFGAIRNAIRPVLKELGLELWLDQKKARSGKRGRPQKTGYKASATSGASQPELWSSAASGTAAKT